MADVLLKNGKKKKKQKVDAKGGKKHYANYPGSLATAKEKRNEKIMHSYKKLKRKEMKQQQQKTVVNIQQLLETIGSSDDESPSAKHPLNTYSKTQVQQSKQKGKVMEKKDVSRFSKSQWEQQKRKEQKQKKIEEMQRKKSEKDEAIEKYRKKKKEKFLKLCKKNAKGQPVIKYQMHYLLEKLEQQHKERTAETF